MVYAPLKAMVTKISKWSRIQDSFRITPKIESLVVFAIPDIPRKFQKDPYITFWVILLRRKQTNKQTNKVWQKHNLLGGGNHISMQMCFIFLLLFIFNSFTKELHGRNGRSGTAVFRENIVAICTHDTRLWIWIWMANFISTASLAINRADKQTTAL